MTLDPDFLQILACPATRKPLRELTAAELLPINAAIARGGVTSRGGTPVATPLQGGLQPQGEPIVYPIQDGIPILLTAEAILLDRLAGSSGGGRTVEGSPEPR